MVTIILMHRQDKQEWAKERKDLYDRIMAGTLSDYKENVTATPNTLPEEDPNIVSLEDARSDIMGEEQEDID